MLNFLKLLLVILLLSSKMRLVQLTGAGYSFLILVIVLLYISIEQESFNAMFHVSTLSNISILSMPTLAIPSYLTEHKNLDVRKT